MRISDWSSDVCSSDLVYHAGCLFAAHHRRARVRPREDEMRTEAAAAHAVVAGAERAAHDDGDLRHGGVGDCLNHLRAVLDDAALLAFGTDHVAGRVHQIDDRDVGLRSEEHTSELQSLKRISYAALCL